MTTTNADQGGRAGGLSMRWSREATTLAAVLIALAVVAFLVRLVPVLLGGGLGGKLGFDDTVYYGDAVALVEGRLPYRDFNILHPPGIMYLLSPFALIGGVTGDTTAFGLARLAFMVLGAINTILVGVVGLRAGRLAAVLAAATFAVWSAAVQWDRTTYLVAPQGTLLLLALLLLTRRDPLALTTRQVALAGALIGVAGVIQVWTVVPAFIVFGWLILAFRVQPRRLVRIVGAYVAGGVATALLLMLPLLVTTGPRMIQMVIFAQLGRAGAFSTGRVERLRLLEGLPANSHLANRVPDALVILALVAAVCLIAVAARQRREIRLWVAVLAGQIAFVMVTPVFFPHYSGWIAPQAALAIGATAATVIGWFGPHGRRVGIGVFAVGLAGLMLVSLRPDGERVRLTPTDPDLSAARCVTADVPIVLIATETLRRDLRNGCRLLLNPNSLSHVFNAGRAGGRLPRSRLPEYQREMEAYYGSGDAVIIARPNKAGLSPETWTKLRARFPIELHRGPITILLAAAP